MAITTKVTLQRVANRRRILTGSRSTGKRGKARKDIKISEQFFDADGKRGGGNVFIPGAASKGLVSTFAPVSKALHARLEDIWLGAAAKFAISVINKVAKDTGMTAASLVPLGDKLGEPYKGIIKELALKAAGKTKVGHFKKPSSGEVVPGYSKTGIRGSASGISQARGGARILTGGHQRPVFKFQWDYATWQHLVMDFGRPGSDWHSNPLRTVELARIAFIDDVTKAWTAEATDFARFWTFEGPRGLSAEQTSRKQARDLFQRALFSGQGTSASGGGRSTGLERFDQGATEISFT